MDDGKFRPGGQRTSPPIRDMETKIRRTKEEVWRTSQLQGHWRG